MTERKAERSGRARVRLTPETPELPGKLILGVLPPNPARHTFRLRREAATPVLVVATLALVAGTLALLKDVMLPTLSPAAPASIWVQPPKAAPKTSGTMTLIRLAAHLRHERRDTHTRREDATVADRHHVRTRGDRGTHHSSGGTSHGRDDGSFPSAPQPHPPSSSGSSSSSGSTSGHTSSGDVGDDASGVSGSNGSSGPGRGASGDDGTSQSSPSGSSGSGSASSGSSGSGSSGSGSSGSGSSGSGSSGSAPSGSGSSGSGSSGSDG